MEGWRKLMHVSYLLTLFSAQWGCLAAESDDCHEYGTLDKLSEFYLWREKNLMLKWEEENLNGIARKIQMLKNVADLAESIPETMANLKRLAQGKKAMFRPPTNPFGRENLIVTMEADSTKNAYDKCHAESGSFPSPRTMREEAELAVLAHKYQVLQMYVDASLDPTLAGPTSSNGYVYGFWNTKGVKRPTAAALADSDFRHVLVYQFDIRPHLQKPLVTWFGTVWDDNRKENKSFLCLIPSASYVLSLDQINTMEVIMDTLTVQSRKLAELATSKEDILSTETVNNLPEIKEGTRTYPAGEILIGIESYEPLLYPLASIQYYQSTRVNHIFEINQINQLMKNTIEEFDTGDWITMQTNSDLRKILVDTEGFRNKRSDVDNLISNTIMNHLLTSVKFRVNKVYEGFISNTSIRSISTKEKVKISKIRKFTNKEGKHLSDNYVVNDKKESFSSRTLPKGQECTYIGTFRACRDIYVSSESGGSNIIKNDICGKSLTQHSSTRGCKEEDVQYAVPYILKNIRCSGEDDKGPVRYYDILNANFDGELVRECDGEDSTNINFTKGHTKLPISYGNCNYLYGKTMIHGLLEGDEIPDEDRLHETIFGTYNTKDLRWLLYSIVTVSFTIILTLIIGFCPRVRIWISNQCFCCCSRGGYKRWKVMCRSRCNNCRDCITGEESEEEMTQMTVEMPPQPDQIPYQQKRRSTGYSSGYGPVSFRGQDYPLVVAKRPAYPAPLTYDPRSHYPY